jgi:hypothetical protein
MARRIVLDIDGLCQWLGQGPGIRARVLGVLEVLEVLQVLEILSRTLRTPELQNPQNLLCANV